MLDQVKNEANEKMDKAIASFKNALARVRTGRASASALDGITIDYYGSPTPLNQVGQISTPEARLLQIHPFDKTQIAAIEKAILNANIGVTPMNDGNVVRIPFPALTEEKRKQIVKDVKKITEDAKIAIRNIRRDQNEIVKKSEKDKEISEDDSKKFQAEIQKITDNYITKVDGIAADKEKEVMTV